MPIARVSARSWIVGGSAPYKGWEPVAGSLALYPLPLMKRALLTVSAVGVAAGVACFVAAITGAGRLSNGTVSNLALAALLLPHAAAAPLMAADRLAD